jgi:hypothetical protein
MLNPQRFTVAGQGSPMTDVVARALAATGSWSIPAMREPGFKMLESIMEDPIVRAVQEQMRMRGLAAAPLPERAQVVVDRAVVEVGLQRLTFVADLLAEGLVYNLTDPLSVTQLEHYSSSKVGAAQRTMTPSARGENKLPLMLPGRLPVYLTTDTFELDIRTLKMSERVGIPLDTALIKQCTRSVNEALEDAAINGATTLDGQALNVAGYAAPGLLNAPNANVYALSVNWTAANVIGTTGPAMLADLQGMIAAAQADLKFGPYNLYVGTTAGIVIEGDFKLNGDLSIRQRLEQISIGGRPIRIRVTDMFPGASTGAQCALVQMTSDVVDLVNGQPPTVIPWTSLDGFTIHNLVMAIMIPRFRSDYNGNSGVVIGSKA